MNRWESLAAATTIAVAVLCGVCGPVESFASGVPSPADSDVPDCLIACPEGEITYRIIVRDFAHFPIHGAFVTLDFAACAAFPYCGPTSAPYSIDAGNRTISRPTGPSGIADFNLALRGTCGNSTVRVFADGVQLDNVRIAIMDQNGDGAVEAADVAIATANIGSANRSADVDCSGTVTLTDANIIAAHDTHECPLPTPARRSHWGALKLIYR